MKKDLTKLLQDKLIYKYHPLSEIIILKSCRELIQNTEVTLTYQQIDKLVQIAHDKLIQLGPNLGLSKRALKEITNELIKGETNETYKTNRTTL